MVFFPVAEGFLAAVVVAGFLAEVVEGFLAEVVVAGFLAEVVEEGFFADEAGFLADEAGFLAAGFLGFLGFSSSS